MQYQVNRLKREKRDLDKRIENLVNENDCSTSHGIKEK